MALIDLCMVYGALKNVKAALVTWEMFAIWNLVIHFYNCYNIFIQIQDINFGAGMVFIVFQIVAILIVYGTIGEINLKKTNKNDDENHTCIFVIDYSNTPPNSSKLMT